MDAHGRESDGSRRFFDNGRNGKVGRRRGVDQALYDVAAAQHLVIALAQLVEVGLSPRAVQHRVARRLLHRIHRGVYALVPRTHLTIHGHWMAAILACGEGAHLSHTSCAHLLNVRRGPGYPVHVTVARRSALRVPGLIVHRCELPENHRTSRAGIPCTSFARTLLDIAPQLTPEGLKSVLDKAEDNRLDFSEVPDLIAASAGRRGVRKLRRVALSKGIGLDVTRSQVEETFLGICRRSRLPEPRVNFPLDLGDGLPMVELDFFWPDLSACVETDGGGGHGTLRAVERDYARERRIARAGISITRFSDAEVWGRPDQVGDELEGHLARAAARAK